MIIKKRLARGKVRADAGPRVAYLATYPPTECGIATFTEDLVKAVDRQRELPRAVVIAINPEERALKYPPNVRFVISRNRAFDYTEAARFVNDSNIDMVCIQHEYGIFGGDWGGEVLTFLKALRKPAVATLHTVLRKPEPLTRQVTQELCRLCRSVVVMNSIASHILQTTYAVPADKIRHIHHGAPVFRPELKARRKAQLKLTGRKIISTFGLINPGKGIEYAIRAMPQVIARHPDALYLILGQTHPGVRKHSGETYREMLERTIQELGLKDHVVFDNRYLTKPQLISYLEASDIYVTPYLNPEQMVSGALCYASAAGLPIISTPYLYAFEMLGNGRGMIVDFRDPTGIGECLNLLLDSPTLREMMVARTYEFGRQLAWDRIGAQHVAFLRQMALAPVAAPQPRYLPPAYREAQAPVMSAAPLVAPARK